MRNVIVTKILQELYIPGLPRIQCTFKMQMHTPGQKLTYGLRLSIYSASG